MASAVNIVPVLETAKRLLVVSGSRADFGLLEWPFKLLTEQWPNTEIMKIWGETFERAFDYVSDALQVRPRLMLVLGDRFEILAAATAAHLARVPIAHIGGGDVTEGSYDDAMRDAISRMASIHFVTSYTSMARLMHLGYRNVHFVGNTGVDYIRCCDKWRAERPIAEPYVVVSYQPETLDGTVDMEAVIAAVNGRRAVCIAPNPDWRSEAVVYPQGWDVREYVPHAEFLNLLAHCEEFIGNSSAMLYEAPELGVKTRMIGKRQRGRVLPWGDGKASERIVDVLKYTTI